jgi:hypothetical protein
MELQIFRYEVAQRPGTIPFVLIPHFYWLCGIRFRRCGVSFWIFAPNLRC